MRVQFTFAAIILTFDEQAWAVFQYHLKGQRFSYSGLVEAMRSSQAFSNSTPMRKKIAEWLSAAICAGLGS